jgi:hypothetical protein
MGRSGSRINNSISSNCNGCSDTGSSKSSSTLNKGRCLSLIRLCAVMEGSSLGHKLGVLRYYSKNTPVITPEHAADVPCRV